jgi:hypothetical protein
MSYFSKAVHAEQLLELDLTKHMMNHCRCPERRPKQSLALVTWAYYKLLKLEGVSLPSYFFLLPISRLGESSQVRG